MTDRLNQALQQLGYAQAKKNNQKASLIASILLFASINVDAELMDECEAELKLLGDSKTGIESIQINVAQGQRVSGSADGLRVQINMGDNQRVAGRDYIER
jgi:hypothetical protein